MPLRLYMDQDSLGGAVVRSLRMAGIDVLTTSEAGHGQASDEEQLAFATIEGRMIYTANLRDFARMHKEWMETGRSHAGIVARFEQQLSESEQIRGLRRICTAFEPDRAVNLFLYLENWSRLG